MYLGTLVVASQRKLDISFRRSSLNEVVMIVATPISSTSNTQKLETQFLFQPVSHMHFSAIVHASTALAASAAALPASLETRQGGCSTYSEYHLVAMEGPGLTLATSPDQHSWYR